MRLEEIIEALLFATGETYTIGELSRLISRDQDEVEEALADLELSLKNRGIKLLREKDRVTLVAIKEISPIVEALQKKELTTPLSQAAMDTISVILYMAPIEKKNIDLLRGVDSRKILRTLRARDLIRESREGEKVVYNPTVKLLQFMGLESEESLPDYKNHRQALINFLNENEEDS
ncbi:MAG: SMC-Scp complex subunit ScpB [Candidatus Campbellbacteria bacterium]|nr:SMC-Scp complex subunit ScpB [Candidatus Campbellbacteria bacterium]